jgi:hypothetical protein
MGTFDRRSKGTAYHDARIVALQLQQSLAHRAPALALEVPQETDRIFRTPSQSVCENQGATTTRSSGSLVLTPHVHSRSPTPATLQFATTAALAVVTHVARHLGLVARVRPPARTPLAAPEALVVLSLSRMLLSTPTGATKASTRNTTLLLTSFRATM